jgi:uncharacterized integral membrane protein (TIGR00698 family)
MSLVRLLPPLDRHATSGVTFVVLFACAAQQLAQTAPLIRLGISPLIVGIVIGMFYGNTLRGHLPAQWVPGILFSSKTLLRLAVMLYGFRISVQDIAQIGLEGFGISVIMLGSTFTLGAWAGIRLFRLPSRLALMIAAGSAVCGAAAVLAAEPVVKGRAHESSVAVGTVVIFGTLAMFLYPLAWRAGWLGMDAQTYGLFAGASLHEVAHVVAAGRAVSAEAAANAVIAKMLRVMMLAPLLAGLAFVLARRGGEAGTASAASFPWFAIGFIACAGINSLHVVPAAVVEIINGLDLFLLTMAMCALGMETSFAKVRQVGARPFLLAAGLALWLALGGYWVTVLMHRWLGTV